MPVLSRPQVATAPLPRVRTNPAAEGAELGAAFGVAAEVLGVFERERREALDVRINAAEVRARDARTRILTDPQTGILARRGQDAFNAPEEADAEWAKVISEIESEFGDSEAREVFRARADALRSELRATSMRHALSEKEALDAASTEALVKDSLDAIAGVAADASQVNVHLERATQLLDGRLRRQGMSDEVREAEVRQVRSAGRASQLVAMANTENPDVLSRAREIFANEQGTMTTRDRTTVERALEDAGSRATAQTATDELVALHPDDEDAALAEARRRYSGKTEDDVVQRIKVRFDEQQQGRVRRVNNAFNTALGAVERGEPIPDAARSVLLADDPGKLNTLRTRQQQVARGVPIETTPEVFQAVFLDMPMDEVARLNPQDYVTQLSRNDFERLVSYVKQAQSGIAGRAMNPGQIGVTLLERMRRDGIVPETVRTLGDLKNSEDKKEFNALNNAVNAAMQARVTANNGVPLNGTEQREVINQVMDDVVIERGMLGGLIGGGPKLRALTDPRRVQEMTFDQRMEFVRTPRAGDTRETYWQRLVDAGVDPETATAMALREISGGRP